MDLKDFVKNSLSQIAEGIIDANETLSDTDAIVNPTEIVVNSDNSQAYGRTLSPALQDDPTRVVEKVEFDVAVTVQEGESTNAGIKVSVMSIGIGASGESSSTSGSQSRIKFTIPIVFPSKRT
ncbi:MAG: trypco2 family protein [Mariprofundus sp.]|nr:trypco2 family protein [Mariprofundus sp.]